MGKAQHLAKKATVLASACLESCTDDLMYWSAGDHEAIIHAGWILQARSADLQGAERLIHDLALTLLSATFDETVDQGSAQDIA